MLSVDGKTRQHDDWIGKKMSSYQIKENVAVVKFAQTFSPKSGHGPNNFKEKVRNPSPGTSHLRPNLINKSLDLDTT